MRRGLLPELRFEARNASLFTFARVIARSGCSHPRLVFRKHADRCYWAICAVCGCRGPRKHSRPLARSRFGSVGTAFRWSPTAERWTYTRTAAQDDRANRVRRRKRSHQKGARS